MKKAANILCVISAILACLAVVFLIFTPKMLGESSYLVGAGASSFDIFSETILANWPAGHKAFIDFGNYQSNVVILIFAIALLLIVVLWIVHIVIMAVKKRGNSTWVNVAFILFGLVSLDLVYIFLIPGYLGGTTSIMDSVLAISDVMKKILGLLPYVLAAISLVLVVIALFVSFADMAKNPGAKKRFSQVPDGFVNVGAVSPAVSKMSEDKKDINNGKASVPATNSKNDDEIRSILNSELGDETASSNSNVGPIVEGSGCGKGATAINPGSYSGPAPTIVQYISYGPDGNKGSHGDEKPLTRDDIRDLVAAEMKKQNSTSVEETVPNDSEVLTSDDLRSIIHEEIAGTPKEKSTPNEVTPNDETKETETTQASTNPTGEVMTSEDLRQIVAEEIAKATKGETKVDATSSSGDSDVLTSDDLRSIIREELGQATKDIEQKEKDDISAEAAPAAKEVEEETSDVLTSDDLRSIVAEEIAKANGKETPKEAAPSAAPVEEKTPVDEAITTDDLRSIIREELTNKEGQEKVETVSEEKPEDKPLTANDLRTLIQEALEEHDNPERRQLTEDEARDLIVEQIRSFYLGKEKDEDEKAKKEEVKAEPEVKPTPKDEVTPTPVTPSNNNEILSSDDLRAIIHEEIASIKPVAQPAPVNGEGVSSDDIKKLLSDELAKFRAEQTLANQKAADEAADAHKIEQARAEAEAEQTKAQSEEIKNIKSSALSPDDIRSIVAEELDKKLAEKSVVTEKVVALPAKEEVKNEPVETAKPVEATKKEEVKPAPKAVIAPLTPKEEVKKEVKPAPAPAPKQVVTPVVVTPVETKDEEEDSPKAKIIRIPFSDRMLKADKELQSNYNELKAECLSYGLKSRLSNSGDTFRLHTKTYVKITIAGKGLKLYFALNPKDYASGPIPLHDASEKNIYKEIPGVFKVKSPLSLKRAKQLLADAVEKDNLEQGKIEPHNWAIELKDYKPQLGGKDDED